MACCGVLVVIASVATAGVEMSAELAGVWVLLGACVFLRQNPIRRNPRGNPGGPNFERPYLGQIAGTRAEN